MANKQRVHLLLKEGPEWSEVLDVYADTKASKQKAQDRADEFNSVPEELRPTVFERLSSCRVQSFIVKH